MVEKILNNTTPYGNIRASHEGSLHSYTLSTDLQERPLVWWIENAKFERIFFNGIYQAMIQS